MGDIEREGPPQDMDRHAQPVAQEAIAIGKADRQAREKDEDLGAVGLAYGDRFLRDRLRTTIHIRGGPSHSTSPTS